MKRFNIKPAILLMSMMIAILLSCASDGNRPPELFVLEDKRLEVNVNFQLEVTAFDKDEDFLTYDYSLTPPPPTQTQGRGGVPTLQKVSAYKAIFSWTPGNADIGQYSLTITVQDENQAQSSETITLTVVDSNQSGTGGIRFIKPEGSVTILNIDQNSCLETEVQLQAESFTDAELSVSLRNAPQGSTLDNLGNKTYQLMWCPTQNQLQTQQSFIFEFLAENTRGIAPVSKEYVVQVRSNGGQECLGSPPTITHTPLATQRGVLNYVITAQVTDDQAITIDPILAYQYASVSQEFPSDSWTFVSMSLANSSNLWNGVIPVTIDSNGTKIFYQIIAKDDDDLNGITCDHVTETEVYSFDAYWDQNDMNRLNLCDFCVNDTQCGGGDDRCIPNLDDLGGICGQNCDLDQICADGFECINIHSIDGIPSYQCVSDAACGLVCESDQYDRQQDNQTKETASTLMPGTYSQLTLCGSDIDFYQVNVNAGQSLSSRLSFNRQEGYLNLRLYFEQDDQMIPVAAYMEEQQQVANTPCVSQNQNVLVEVSSTGNPKNTYQLDLALSNQCNTECTPDLFEGESDNNSAIRATTLSLNQEIDANLCDRDVDFYQLTLTEGNQINFNLVFLDPLSEQENIELQVLNPNFQTQNITLNRINGLIQGDFIANESGIYFIHVFARYSITHTPYRLSLQSSILNCDETTACPEGQYCTQNQVCVSATCTESCENNHECLSKLAGTVPSLQSGQCLAYCDVNSDCPLGMTCKNFESFSSYCAYEGSAAIGEGCQDYTDCSDQMICFPTPGGYCAVGGCQSDQECPSQSICTEMMGGYACVKSCINDLDCERNGYQCRALAQGSACVP